MPVPNSFAARWKKPLLITSLIASLALNTWFMSRDNNTNFASIASLPDLDISERQELFSGQAGVLETNFHLDSKSHEETLSVTFNTPMTQQAAQNILIFTQGFKPKQALWLSERHLELTFPRRNATQALSVKLQPAMQDASGQKLASWKKSFDAPGFAILEKTRREEEVILKLNWTPKKSDLQKGLKLKLPGGKTYPLQNISIIANKQKGFCSLKIRHIQFAKGGRFQIRFGKELCGKEAFAVEFAAQQRLQFTQAKFYDNSLRLKTSNYACIPFDEKNLNFVELSPKVENLTWSNSWDGIRLHGDFTPGTKYRVTLKEGLQDEHGYKLNKDKTFTLSCPDYEAELSLQVPNDGILPLSREAVLPVKVTNTQQVEVELYRILRENAQQTWFDESEHGILLSKTKWNTKTIHNKQETLNFPLKDLLKEIKDKGGIYRLRMRYKTKAQNSWCSSDSATFSLTDTGLSAVIAQDEVQVWVTSISEALPKIGMEVEVYSSQRRSLGKGKTDAQGIFKCELLANSPLQPAFVIARKGKEDVAWLHLNNTQDLKAARLKGHALPHQSCLASFHLSRGIARPGENFTASLILREGKSLAAQKDTLVQLRLKDSRGKVLKSWKENSGSSGLIAIQLKLDKNWPLGRMSLQASAPGQKQVWGKTTFQLAEYVPDQIKLKSLLLNKNLTNEQGFQINLQSDWYYGQPASGLKSELSSWIFKERAKFTNFPTYVFDQSDEISDTATGKLQGETNEQGQCQLKGKLEFKAPPAPGLWKVRFQSSVQQRGGRAVSDTIETTWHNTPYYIGLRRRPLSKGSSVGESQIFDWICLKPDGSECTQIEQMELELVRMQWSGNYYNNGRYRWEKKAIAVKKINLETKQLARGEFELPLLVRGEYRLIARSKDKSAAPTQLEFYHGWNAPKHNMASPSWLSLQCNAETLILGKEYEVTFQSPNDGSALLCCGLRDIDSAQSFAVTKGKNSIKFRAPQQPFGSLALQLTLVLRDDARGKLPRRMFGLLNMPVSQLDKKLEIRLSMEKSARPETKHKAKIQLLHQGKNIAGKVHVFAVDEGILALTRHASPRAHQSVYGRYLPDLDFCDNFDQLMPQADLRLRSGELIGGGGSYTASAFKARRSQDQAQALIDLGILDIPKTGRKIEIDLPDFEGQLRFMAVAVSEDALGSLEQKLELKSPVTIKPSFPRVLSHSDEWALTAELGLNEEISSLSLKIIEVEGLKVIGKSRFDFAQNDLNNQQVHHNFRLKTTIYDGMAKGVILVKHSEGEKRIAFSIPVRPPHARSSQSQLFVIKAGESHQLDLAGKWLPGSARVNLALASTPLLRCRGAVNWLRSCSWNCLEQRSSRAVPELLAQAGFLEKNEQLAENSLASKTFCQSLQNLQLMNGSFAMWEGSTSTWSEGSIHALLVLSEARRRKLAIDEKMYKGLLSWAESEVNELRDIQDAGLRCMLLPLLALEGKGRPDLANIILLRKNSSRLNQFLAVLALNIEGKTTGDFWTKLDLPALLREAPQSQFDRAEWRAALAVWGCHLCDQEVLSKQAFALLEGLKSNGHWGTTSANAFALLAYARQETSLQTVIAPAKAKITLPSGKQLSLLGKATLAKQLAGKGVLKINNLGKSPLFLSLQSSGLSLKKPADESSSGGLRASYFLKGIKANKELKLIQGELLRGRIEIDAPSGIKNLVAVLLLPAGLELEDPNLKTRAAAADQAKGIHLQHIERRDDRLIIYFDIKGNKPHSLNFQLRAVTPGKFTLPHLSVEALYQPSLKASCGGGKLEVN